MSRYVPDSGDPNEMKMERPNGHRRTRDVTMRHDGRSRLGALGHAAILALSGFMLMSSLAALGSGHAHARPYAELDDRSFQDSSAHLVLADQRPDTNGQPAAVDCRRERTSPTSGCASPTRTINSASTSVSSVAASSDRPAASNILAYSNFVPVANR